MSKVGKFLCSLIVFVLLTPNLYARNWQYSVTPTVKLWIRDKAMEGPFRVQFVVSSIEGGESVAEVVSRAEYAEIPKDQTAVAVYPDNFKNPIYKSKQPLIWKAMVEGKIVASGHFTRGDDGMFSH